MKVKPISFRSIDFFYVLLALFISLLVVYHWYVSGVFAPDITQKVEYVEPTERLGLMVEWERNAMDIISFDTVQNPYIGTKPLYRLTTKYKGGASVVNYGTEDEIKVLKCTQKKIAMDNLKELNDYYEAEKLGKAKAEELDKIECK